MTKPGLILSLLLALATSSFLWGTGPPDKAGNDGMGPLAPGPRIFWAAKIRSFSLSHRSLMRMPAAAGEKAAASSRGEGTSRSGAATAALQIIGANFLVWSFDRYVMEEEWARIDLDSIWTNMKSGFVWDTDKFTTNFFSHPYHGSLYFNAARSNGLGFWTSSLYTFAGSMMWELFMERNHPSINDLIMTTTGGITLGEILFRLSSLVTRDADRGNVGLIREIAGWVVNPMRGLTRMIKGGSGGIAGGGDSHPVRGALIWSGNIVSRSPELYDVDRSTVSQLYLVYGSPFDSQAPRRPYDYFSLSGSLWRGPENTSISLSAQCLLFGRNLSRGRRWKHLFGLFQHYDFINFETIEIGGSSFCPGFVTRFELSDRVAMTASYHLGWLMLGASRNEYVREDLRDYNYGTGLTSKLDTILDLRAWGMLSLRWSSFLIQTIRGAEGLERLDLIKAMYSLPVWKMLNLGIDYSVYRRESDYLGFQDVQQSYYEARLFFALMF